VAETCPGWGPDMSGFAYWNPARKPDMSEFSREFDSKEFFDDLHFTNSPNASPLIVQSSYDKNKIKLPNPQGSSCLFPFSSL
jgi:hypothetical protein